MKLVRLYTKYSFDQNIDDLILWESLIWLNHSKHLCIPITIWTLLFHIVLLKSNDINKVLEIYNFENKSFSEIQKMLENIDSILFLDLEYNLNYILKNKDDEFREYLHPRKQNEFLKEEIYKTLSILSKKHWRWNINILLSSKYDNLKLLYNNIWNIFSEDDILFNYQSQSKWISLELLRNKRDRESKTITIFSNYLANLKNTSKRYKSIILEFWEDQVNKRLNYEYKIIKENWYIEYFFTCLKIIKYLEEKNIIFFLKGSAVWSLLLYLLEVSNINPLKYNISFERFLWEGKIADIDIDIPSESREKILLDLNKYFNTENKEVLFILNKSSENYNKYTEHPTGILIEDKDYIKWKLPLIKWERETLSFLTSELYDSSSTPVLEELWFLKFDLIRSQVLSEIQSNISKKWLSIFEILKDWENKVNWNKWYLKEILKWNYFQLNSQFAKDLVYWIMPSSYFDLVKLVAVNRPALIRNYKKEYIIEQLKNPKLNLKDKEIQKILEISQSWNLILFQDQVIDLVKLLLPNLRYQEVINLVKARDSKFSKYKSGFIQEADRRLDDKKYSENLWDMIEKFDKYGLNKWHAMSYALITFLQLYIKLS